MLCDDSASFALHVLSRSFGASDSTVASRESSCAVSQIDTTTVESAQRAHLPARDALQSPLRRTHRRTPSVQLQAFLVQGEPSSESFILPAPPLAKTDTKSRRPSPSDDFGVARSDRDKRGNYRDRCEIVPVQIGQRERIQVFGRDSSSTPDTESLMVVTQDVFFPHDVCTCMVSSMTQPLFRGEHVTIYAVKDRVDLLMRVQPIQKHALEREDTSLDRILLEIDYASLMSAHGLAPPILVHLVDDEHHAVVMKRGTTTLADFLDTRAVERVATNPRKWAFQTMSVIHKMSRIGIYNADLSATNVVLEMSDAGKLNRTFLIDFDAEWTARFDERHQLLVYACMLLLLAFRMHNDNEVPLCPGPFELELRCLMSVDGLATDACKIFSGKYQDRDLAMRFCVMKKHILPELDAIEMIETFMY